MELNEEYDFDEIDDEIINEQFDDFHCRKCGCVLTSENRASGTNWHWCRSCKKKADSEYKKRRRMDADDTYSEEEKQRAKKYYRTIYSKRRDELLNKYKGPCAKCGENSPECIVFHHINPKEKNFCVGGGALGKHTESEIAEEVKKCICLCENCHRKFHHKYFHQLDNPICDLKSFLNQN